MDKELSPLKKLLEQQEVYNAIIGDDIRDIKQTQHSLLSETIDNNKLAERDTIGTNTTFNSNSVLNDSKELDNEETALDNDDKMLHILKSIDDKLGKGKPVTQTHNITELLYLIKNSSSLTQKSVSNEQKIENKEKEVEKVKEPDNYFFKGFKDLLKLNERSPILQFIKERKVFKDIAKETGGKLDKRYTLRGALSNVKTNLVDNLNPFKDAVGEAKLQKEYVAKVLKNNAEIREQYKNSTIEQREEIVKNLTADSIQIKELSKVQANLEQAFENNIKNGVFDETPELVKLEAQIEKLKTSINAIDKSVSVTNEKVLEGELVETTTTNSKQNTDSVSNSINSELINIGNDLKETVERSNVTTTNSKQNTDLVNDLKETVERSNNVSSVNVTENLNDKTNVSEEEKGQLDFQNKVLEIEKGQLDIQKKIYALLGEQLPKLLESKKEDSESNKDKKGLFSNLFGDDDDDDNGLNKKRKFKNRKKKGSLKRGLGSKLKGIGRGLARPAVALGTAGLVAGSAVVSGGVKLAEEIAPKISPMIETAKETVPKLTEGAKKLTPKLVNNETLKNTGELITKSISKRLPKAMVGSLLKQIPVLGTVAGTLAGLAFAGKELLEGDIVGAGLEATSAVPIAGVAASLGAVARDVYSDVYGIEPEKDPDVGARFDEIKTEIQNQFITNSSETKQTKPDNKSTEELSKLSETKTEEFKETNLLDLSKAPTINNEPVKVDNKTKEELSKLEDYEIQNDQIDTAYYETANESLSNKIVHETPITTINNEPVKAEQVKVTDYDTALSKIETERLEAAKVLGNSENAPEDIEEYYVKLDKLKDKKSEVIAKRDNKPIDVVRDNLDVSRDITSRTHYNMKPEATENNKAETLYNVSKEVEEAKQSEMKPTATDSNQTISPTNIINNNSTTVVRKEPRNEEHSLNQLYKTRSIFNN
jgi:hypothetical protein